jgi:hypothetical protein
MQHLFLLFSLLFVFSFISGEEKADPVAVPDSNITASEFKPVVMLPNELIGHFGFMEWTNVSVITPESAQFLQNGDKRIMRAEKSYSHQGIYEKRDGEGLKMVLVSHADTRTSTRSYVWRKIECLTDGTVKIYEKRGNDRIATIDDLAAINDESSPRKAIPQKVR